MAIDSQLRQKLDLTTSSNSNGIDVDLMNLNTFSIDDFFANLKVPEADGVPRDKLARQSSVKSSASLEDDKILMVLDGVDSFIR